jgi:hypothetical protein
MTSVTQSLIEQLGRHYVPPGRGGGVFIPEVGTKAGDCMNLIMREPMPTAIADRLRELDAQGALDFLPPGEQDRLRRENFCYLPIPPKSSCFFCPFHRPEAWDDQARTHPDLFQRSCQLEDLLNERRARLGKDPVYLTRFGQPLRTIVRRGQDTLWQDDDPDWHSDTQCDSGHCFT